MLLLVSSICLSYVKARMGELFQFLCYYFQTYVKVSNGSSRIKYFLRHDKLFPPVKKSGKQLPPHPPPYPPGGSDATGEVSLLSMFSSRIMPLTSSSVKVCSYWLPNSRFHFSFGGRELC